MNAALDDIVDDVTQPAERTLILDVLLEQFLDRAAREPATHDIKSLARWVSETYDRYPDIGSLHAVFASVWQRLGHSADDDVASAIRQRRSTANVALNVTLDEIDACIADLVARLFDHDPITAEHSRAVSSWCARIARKLGLSTADTLLVRRGGLLHDIGKVGTPEEILNAPRKLTLDEWSFMKRHTEDGAEIIADVPMLSDFLPAIRSHHERLDGTGYPDGLRGEAIPLSARVVSVADCFNAMIGRRPYRPPMAPHRALDQLLQDRGGLDREVVEALVGVVGG